LHTNDTTITFPDYSNMVNPCGPDEPQRPRDAEDVLLTAMAADQAHTLMFLVTARRPTLKSFSECTLGALAR